MLIGFEKKFIFVANTKAGSTSIESALDAHADLHITTPPKRKHIKLRDVLDEHGQAFEQKGVTPEALFRFGVMREPLDWILSWFRYRKGNKVANPLPAEMTFADFWQRRDWNIQRADGRRFLQESMFCDLEGRVIADVIIPYEQIDTGYSLVCRHLGIDSRLPHMNVSTLRKAEQLSDALLAEVREFYARDYALYNRLEVHNASAWARLSKG